jgi:methionyl-tRNA formyltransferase
MKIIFFGSTTDSLLVLEKLPLADIVAVVTQPPKPVGRKQIIATTPVELWAKKNSVTVLSFPTQEAKPWAYADEQPVIDALQPMKPDLLVSACYGQKIPGAVINAATHGGINVHPSLLPRWRGADPVPWAIYSGDHQTGVTLVRLSATFDQGTILAQEKLNISDTDTAEPLRAKLFTMGAELLAKTLPDILSGKIKGHPQQIQGTPYARRLTRDDGFEPWEKIMDPHEIQRIKRKFRAFDPWPGIWTTYNGKRLKILGFTTLPTIVQLEGKKPVSWEQFKRAYLAS